MYRVNMGNKPSTQLKRRQERRNVPHEKNDEKWTTKQEKCYDPFDPSLTFVDGEDELDFLCMDYKSLRALLSCGHACTPISLTDHCRRLLDEGESRFVCGQTDCDVEWPYVEVCKMALLTPEEREEFEKKMFANAAKDYLNIKACPGCKSNVMRADVHNLCVECTACSSDKCRTYRFCWQCLKEWRGSAPRSDRCGNDDCQNPLKILKTCPEIIFEDVKGVTGCPSIRACPTCGLFLEHNKTMCKNIVCPRCKMEFCFVCLKLTDDCLGENYLELNEDYLDLSEDEKGVILYFVLCSSGVAPRQTSIPVWQRTGVC